MKRIVVIILSFIMLTGLLGMGSKMAAEEEGGGKGVTGGEVKQVTVTAESEGNTIKEQEKTKRIRIEQEGEGEKENRYLKIYDEKGKVKRKIDLGISVQKVKAKNKEGIIKDANLIKRKYAAISDDNKKAVILEYSKETFGGYVENDNDGKLRLEIVDIYGNTLLSKEIEQNREPGSGGGDNPIKILPDGSILIITYYTIGADDTPTDDVLYIYNKSGEETFRFPGKGEQGYLINGYKISPNGKYLGINYIIFQPKSKSSVIFFNLSNGKSWDLGRSAYIKNITDEGKVFVSKKREIDIIDLKSKLGE